MKVLFILLLPLSIALSCGNSKDISTNTKVEQNVASEESAQSSQEFIVLSQQAYGGLDNNEQRVITDEKGLSEIYGIINRFRKPGVPVPNIDFNEHIVIALFMGEKNTGGFSTEVESVSIIGDEMIINVKENEPKPTDMVTMAICQPFCFVKILKPKEEKTVVFEKSM